MFLESGDCKVWSRYVSACQHNSSQHPHTLHNVQGNNTTELKPEGRKMRKWHQLHVRLEIQLLHPPPTSHWHVQNSKHVHTHKRVKLHWTNKIKHTQSLWKNAKYIIKNTHHLHTHRCLFCVLVTSVTWQHREKHKITADFLTVLSVHPHLQSFHFLTSLRINSGQF